MAKDQSTGDDGVMMANATFGKIVLQVGRAGVVGSNGLGRLITLEANHKPVKVAKADYDLLKKTDIFNAYVNDGCIVIGEKVKNEVRATSEPVPPEELRAAMTEGTETPQQGLTGIVERITPEAMTLKVG